MIRLTETLAWTVLVMIMGNMDKGNRKRLKSDNETKAFSESKMFSSEERTYVAKLTNDTKNGAHDHTNEVPEDRYARFLRMRISLDRILPT